MNSIARRVLEVLSLRSLRNTRQRSSARALKETLVALQEITTISAFGSAKTSVRLDSVSTQVKNTSDSLAQLLRAAEQLHEHFGEVSESVRKTLSAAQEMNDLSVSGRTLSKDASVTSAQLQTQMETTVQRIERLVKSVGSIMSVSQTIEGIARQTMLLSFNAAIEAARAGEHGSGFAVVAAEVRSLAQHTAVHTKQIKLILDEIANELTPARQALLASQGLVSKTTEDTRSVGHSLERMAVLADGTAHDMAHVAGALDAQRAGMDTMFANLKTATTSSAAITKDAEAIVGETFAVSRLAEKSFEHFAQVDTDTSFHKGLDLARALASETQALFNRAIASGVCTLDDVLAYEYTEITGSAIAALSRLFDVSRVPPTGFTPPKYHTRYDRPLDAEMQRLIDDVKNRDKMLSFASILDLNLYSPTHHREFSQDWTGIPEKDVINNRPKRFFYDKWLTTSGVRVGLGPASETVPNRASRDMFIQAGCQMTEQPGSRDLFSLRVYVRDPQTVLLGVQVPIFVHGHRFGAASAGWTVKAGG